MNEEENVDSLRTIRWLMSNELKFLCKKSEIYTVWMEENEAELCSKLNTT